MTTSCDDGGRRVALVPGARRFPRILAWGEVLWDLFPTGPRLGGAAANVAHHVAALGGEVALVSRVGADALGERALAALATSGVETALVARDPHRPTGTVRVTLRDGEPLYALESAAAWDRIDFGAAARDWLASAHVLYFGTLAQRTELAAGALAEAWAAAPPGCLRLCDLNVRPPFVDATTIERSLSQADVVKLNRAEAALVGATFATSDPVRWLIDRGVRLVALTRGAGGCRLVTARDAADHPGFPVPLGQGDPVGAGDAFVAVLAVELGRSGALPGDLGALAARANRVAAYVAGSAGAMPALPVELTRA